MVKCQAPVHSRFTTKRKRIEKEEVVTTTDGEAIPRMTGYQLYSKMIQGRMITSYATFNFSTLQQKTMAPRIKNTAKKKVKRIKACPAKMWGDLDKKKIAQNRVLDVVFQPIKSLVAWMKPKKLSKWHPEPLRSPDPGLMAINDNAAPDCAARFLQ